MAAALLAAVPTLRAAPGDLDPSFNPLPNTTLPTPWKAVLAGERFYLVSLVGLHNGWGITGTVYSDIPGDYLTRWNADGTRDSTFNAQPLEGTPPDTYHGTWWGGIFNGIRNFHAFGDDRLLVTGYIQTYGSYIGLGYGATCFSLDSSGHGAPSVPVIGDGLGVSDSSIALRNGGLLLNGRFAPETGKPQPYLIRLNPDTSVDREFTVDKDRDPNPNLYADHASDALAVLADGRILVRFFSVANRTHTLRCLNPDGSYDIPFSETLSHETADFTVQTALPLPDGKILIGGYTGKPWGTGNALVRLRSDGTRDPEFTPPLFESAPDLALQADGKILVWGYSVSAGTIGALPRLNPDGSIDTTFKTPVLGAGSMNLMADGKVIAGKSMLKNDPAISVLERAGAGTVRWRRGGSAPEVLRVSFERRAAGAGSWTLMGEGTRVSGGWELAMPGGLPVEGQIRARGWHPGHPNNSGWVEAMLSLGSPLNEWRLSHFGSPDNAGSGADGADPDTDGFPNLTEYVFGSDPESPSASPVPAWTVSGDFLECRFNLAPGLSPIGITAEWATHPASSPWQTVEGQADGTARSFKIPLGGRQRIFARFRISAPQ